MTPPNRNHWHQQPTVWLGVLLLLAVFVGCVWLIVVAQRYPDPPLEIEGGTVFKMPLGAAPTPAPRPVPSPIP